MYNKEETEKIIRLYEAGGKYLNVDGIKTFYLDAGTGAVVFCIHGVPTSSFLYRKLAFSLMQRGLRIIAIDLPGLGFTDRPEDFNYVFSNFADFCDKFLAVLKLESVHLVVHDVGAPIGLALAAQNSNRIGSITVLNSMLDLEHFTKPLLMRPFENPLLGNAELAMLTPLTFPLMMKYAGVENMDALSGNEMAAYIYLLKRGDEGKAFLKIMRSFDKTPEFTALCYAAFKNEAYPVQLIWGEGDPFLPYDEYGKQFAEARRGIPIHKVKAKHFLPEEQYEVIAAKIKELISSQE